MVSPSEVPNDAENFKETEAAPPAISGLMDTTVSLSTPSHGSEETVCIFAAGEEGSFDWGLIGFAAAVDFAWGLELVETVFTGTPFWVAFVVARVALDDVGLGTVVTDWRLIGALSVLISGPVVCLTTGRINPVLEADIKTSDITA